MRLISTPYRDGIEFFTPRRVPPSIDLRLLDKTPSHAREMGRVRDEIAEYGDVGLYVSNIQYLAEGLR